MPGTSISTNKASLLLPDVRGGLAAEHGRQEAVDPRSPKKARQQPVHFVAKLVERIPRASITKDHDATLLLSTRDIST